MIGTPQPGQPDNVYNGMEISEATTKPMSRPAVAESNAELQGVQVLNVNELANALKSIVLPGEELRVNIVQEGKEVGQDGGFHLSGPLGWKTATKWTPSLSNWPGR